MKKYLSLKKLIRLFIFFLVIGTIIFAMTFNKVINNPLESNDDTVVVEVKEGDGLYDVLNRLDDEGKLSNKLLIKLKLSMSKNKIKLSQGIYEISKDATLNELIESLQNSAENKNLIKLTIPEGFAVEDIADEIQKVGIASREEFLNAVKNYPLPSFVKADEKKRYNLEGYLYPDTYLISKNSDCNDVISLMINEFKQVFDNINETSGNKIKDTDIERIVTIASMIENEAQVERDRTLISSVIYNRLNDDMKLQIDATVLYALGYHVDVVLNKHLEVDSPYNTYKYKGLPEGPIANPGRESLLAAIEPANTNYIYYILEKDGSHYFTSDYNDFLNKKKELGY